MSVAILILFRQEHEGMYSSISSGTVTLDSASMDNVMLPRV